MNTRTMPGFTADRSLYPPKIAYRSAPGRSPGGDIAVLPAQQFGVGGGGGGGGLDCLPIRETCSACIPIGPSAFGRGRRFCQRSFCSPTAFGGCRCSSPTKGFESCFVPRPDVVTF